MRWGARSARIQVPRHLFRAVAAAAAVAVVGAVATGALADVARFTPAVLLEQVFTDNVRGGAEDRDADGLTTVGLRLTGTYQSSRVQAAATATAYYNEYWGTNEFDDFNGEGAALGRLVVLKDRLFVDASATRREIFVTPDITSGAGLSTGATSRQTDVSVGPLLTLNVFDLADLSVRGTYAYVSFDDPVADPLLVPIEDVTAKSVAGRITTGERHRYYELIGTAEHLETDDGFELRNAVGHVLLHLTPSITAIGRYGYEHIADPSITTIRGPRWSFGGRYSLSQTSFVQLEYGHRFGDASWAGEANFLMSPRVLFNAQYSDRLQPAQLSSARSLDELFDDDGNLDLQGATPPIIPNLTLVDQIVRDKDLRATTTYTRGLATFAFTVQHAERSIVDLDDVEKVYRFEVEWREALSRKLTGLATVEFIDNYDPAADAEVSQQYQAEVGFEYLFNTDITLSGSYLWALNDQETQGDAQVNVLRVAMIRAF